MKFDDPRWIDIEFVDADGIDQILEVVREVFRTRPKVRYNWIIQNLIVRVTYRFDTEAQLLKKLESMVADLFAVREVLTLEKWVVRVVANDETAVVQVMLGYYNYGNNSWQDLSVSRLKKGGYLLSKQQPGKIKDFPKEWAAILEEFESGELDDDYI